MIVIQLLFNHGQHARELRAYTLFQERDFDDISQSACTAARP